MRKSNIPFPLIALLLSCVLMVSADAERVARIMYYGASPDAPEKAFVYQKGKEPQEVVLERDNFSESFELASGPLRLMFLPSEVPKDAPDLKKAPFLKIPESWSKVLILVTEDPENPVMPIRLQSINANDNKFGPGDLYFVNFSDINIFGYVGKKELRLKPESVSVITSPLKKRGDYQVQLDSAKEDLKSRRWLLRQTWRHQPNVRRVIFAIPLPPPRQLMLYSAPIRDF